MTDESNITGISRRARLSADVTFLMLKGGGYALIAVLALWLTLSVIWGVGLLLPEESKQAPDPNVGAITLTELPLEVRV